MKMRMNRIFQKHFYKVDNFSNRQIIEESNESVNNKFVMSNKTKEPVNSFHDLNLKCL